MGSIMAYSDVDKIVAKLKEEADASQRSYDRMQLIWRREQDAIYARKLESNRAEILDQKINGHKPGDLWYSYSQIRILFEHVREDEGLTITYDQWLVGPIGKNIKYFPRTSHFRIRFDNPEAYIMFKFRYDAYVESIPFSEVIADL